MTRQAPTPILAHPRLTCSCTADLIDASVSPVHPPVAKYLPYKLVGCITRIPATTATIPTQMSITLICVFRNLRSHFYHRYYPMWLLMQLLQAIKMEIIDEL